MRILFEKISEEKAGDVTLINDLNSNKLILLEGTAYEIWELLRMQSTIDVDCVCNMLVKKYNDVPESMIRNDILDFINSLKELGYVKD